MKETLHTLFNTNGILWGIIGIELGMIFAMSLGMMLVEKGIL